MELVWLGKPNNQILQLTPNNHSKYHFLKNVHHLIHHHHHPHHLLNLYTAQLSEMVMGMTRHSVNKPHFVKLVRVEFIIQNWIIYFMHSRGTSVTRKQASDHF